MGKGSDGSALAAPSLLRRNSWSFDRLKSLEEVASDLRTLKHLWFGSKKGSGHAQRLESFYGPQAAACEPAAPAPGRLRAPVGSADQQGGI